MDTNNDGVIDINEFTTAILSYQTTIKQLKLLNQARDKVNLIQTFELSASRQLSLKTGPKDVKSRLSVDNRQLERQRWRSKAEEAEIRRAKEERDSIITVPSKKIHPKHMSSTLINPSPGIYLSILSY
jgi:hypothetical protein